MNKSKTPRVWLAAFFVVMVLSIIAPAIAGLYVDALWFGSLGQSAVFTLAWKVKALLWVVYFALTFGILTAAGVLLERAYSPYKLPVVTLPFEGQPVRLDIPVLMRRLRWGAALVWGFFGAFGCAARWQEWLLFFHQVPATEVDPLFGKPLGFYFFSYPILTYLAGWLRELAVLIFILAVLWAFLAYVARLPRAIYEKARRVSFLSVALALASVFLVLAWRTYLARYALVWREGEMFYGAGYVEAKVLLPFMALTAFCLVISAALLVFNALRLRSLRGLVVTLLLPAAVYGASAVAIYYVSSFVVKPNEQNLQAPYIAHNIAATRNAFGIEIPAPQAFKMKPGTLALETNRHAGTLDNVRLWDWRALQTSLQKNQSLKSFYDFADVDVDRYVLGGKLRQVMIAARELDSAKLPSRNWINEKLIYTHGYGVTVNTTSDIEPGGRPRFLVSEMPLRSTAPELKVTRPEIYFGQKTAEHVYVKTNQKEFNYPRGDNAEYSTYEGTGGIELGNPVRRLLIAWALGDGAKVPFSDAITPETNVLLHRQVNQRVEKLAPFLSFDGDPYLVISGGRLVWVLDAYTTSDSCPYATPYQFGRQWVNYLRNSVKVTVDAYDGSVHFYGFDEKDPILAAWRKIYPSLFEDASAMPADLRRHVRYPEDLLQVQADVYGLYHMTNPQDFFNRGDAWSVASLNDASGNDQGGRMAPVMIGGRLPAVMMQNDDPQTVEPHYLIMPLDSGPEFILTVPFIPPAKDTLMIGWMAGRSDGAQYGKLWVYSFTNNKDEVPSPQGIRSRISSVDGLSQNIKLWDQPGRGSRMQWGNLLTIPLQGSILYIQPIFLQDGRSPIPELKIVVLATPDKIIYAPTYTEALQKLLGEPGSVETSTPDTGAPKTQPGTKPNQRQLIERGARELAEYQALTAEGKYGEAGKKLEDLKRTLNELKR